MFKKALLTIVAILTFSMLFALSVFAAEITVDGVTYTLTEGQDGIENTAKIKSHEGQTLSTTVITIPEYVESDGKIYYVTEMSSNCFKKTNITEVYFDDNCRVKTIPSSAFYDCNDLTLIDFGKAKITTIEGNAFGYSENLLFKDNKLPCAFTTFSGTQQFDNCWAMTTLVFPESFTYFNTDTRIQQTNIVNLIFLGKMTNVFLGYNKKEGLGGMNVYLCQNTSDELNGSCVETTIYNNAPYYKNVSGAYTEKTDGTLTFVWSSNNANSSGTSTTIDSYKYSLVNTSQDKIYFCGDDRVSFIVRTSGISGGWTSGYVATYDANALEVTDEENNPNVKYKLVPHFAEKTIVKEADCLYPTSNSVVCYCGDVISREIIGTELGDHTYVVDFDCTTSDICSVCSEVINEALEQHNDKYVILYDNGFLMAGYVNANCQNEDCKHSRKVEDTEPLFVLRGYSNATGAIMQSFGVNKEAIEKYNSYAENDIKYGILAASGNVTNIYSGGFNDKVINVDFTNRSYDIMEMKIYGITSATQDTQLYCCGYVEVDGEIIYMDEKMASDATLPTAVTYAGLGGTFAQTASLDAVVPTKEEVLA